MTGQLDMFTGETAPTGPVRPRPAAADRSYAPEFVHLAEGQWALVVFGPIPKLGSEGLDFPHYFGGPAESPRWRVARHAELPGETFLFDSLAQAEHIAALLFPDGSARRRMGWIEIPSDDHRRR